MALPKPAASLSAGLLANKGGARPAMRRQPATGLGLPQARATAPLDDLGWNDMGEDVAPPLPSALPSPVARHIATLEASLSEPAVTVVPTTTTAAVPFSPGSRRWAFTLRLDAERHLKLRLMSAVCDRSAQQLLVEALDALIATRPDIDRLASEAEARGALPGKGEE